MSKIKLNAASGGGSVAWEGPASLGSDKVIKFPNNPSFVIQTVTATTTTQATTTSTTYAEVTSDLRCTIVPTSANSKIIICASLYYSHNAHVITTRILKDGSTFVSGGTTANTHDGDQSTYAGADYMLRTNIVVVDTAGSTSSRYYSPFWNTDTATAYFNRYRANNNYDGTSSLTVMEVSA